MVELDDIIPGKKKEPQEKQPFDKQKWAAEKQQSRKAAYALMDSTAEAICKDSPAFRVYLDVQTRFDRYSIGNALLVTAQKPKATALKDYNAWKDAGTPVKKDEGSIVILEPGEQYSREDGSVGVAMKVKHVFDISQTSAEPETQTTVQYDEHTLMKALISRVAVEIEPVDKIPNPEIHENAYFVPEHNTIYVRRNLETPQLFRALAKELALADFAAQTPNYSRSAKQFKAVCVSYMLMNKYGFDTKDFQISVPSSYASKKAQDVRADLTEIREEAVSIMARMSRTLEPYKAQQINEAERQEAR